MLRYLLSFFFLLPAVLLFGQGFSGSITDESTGKGLPFASIYVKETGSGTVSNEDGDYYLRLPGGSYTLVFQYLGYATQIKRVSTAPSTQRLDLALRPEALELSTIEVLDGQEDKSYSVIRRAIAKADYHRNQVDAYTAEVYVKGTGKIDKIPSFYLKLMTEEERAEIDTTQAFVSESISKISYQRPNTFRQEVVSIYERGDLGADATPYLFASFYSPKVANAISPLSPAAFGYYRFSHEGLFIDRDYSVNKIKVTPRSKGEGVFEGYIYIIENEWSIHSLNLTAYQTGFQFDVRQNYAPIQEKAWMPVTTNVDVYGQLLGIRIRGHYIATASDYEISINPNLPAYLEVIDEKKDPELAKEVKKSNQSRSYQQTLEEGGTLTRKELRRLMRTYEKEEQKTADEPEVLSSYTIVNDSATTTIDSTYWAAIRPVPLTPLEARSYAIQDSVWQFKEENKDSLALVNIEKEMEALDNTMEVSKSFGWLSVSPQLDIISAVEGYALGARLGVEKRGKTRSLQAGISPRYGFGWDRMTLKGDLRYNHAQDGKRMAIELEGGRFLRQIDEQPAMDPVFNAFTMLFSHRNYLSWYERVYGGLKLEQSWGRQWKITAQARYEDRRSVENNSEAGLFYTESRTYRPNIPFNAAIGDLMPDLSAAATMQLQISWEPKQRYTLQNGKKRLIRNTSPLWTFVYAGGLPSIGESTADFHRVELGYKRRFDLGIRGKLDILLRGGTFLSNEQVELPDFKHFATTEISLTAPDPIANYRLLPFYTFSSNSRYVEAFGHYQFRKLLLSRIWRLQRLGIREDIFVNYLYTPESQHYTELGYTIDNIFRIFRLEFITSFQDFKYRDFGIRFAVASIFGRG